MNECNSETEYRCRNGLCIDKIFVMDSIADCLDNSDETDGSNIGCFRGYNWNCENVQCPPLMFSCGDGRCYDGPIVMDEFKCISQRDRLYFKRILPSIRTLFSYITLIYNNSKPKLICYNETLCPHLSHNNYNISAIVTHNGLTCQPLNMFINEIYTDLLDIITSFQCENGNKCLSHHRLSDGYVDCTNGEDERQPHKCSVNLPYHYKCDNGTRCVSISTFQDYTVSTLLYSLIDHNPFSLYRLLLI